LQASTRLAGHLDWPGVAQVCRLQRTTRRKGCSTVEVQYAITSLSRPRADTAFLIGHWRGHWGIENRLHWVRDVTLGEDKCQKKSPSRSVISAIAPANSSNSSA
jgi:predicted transposase YbfD/YdcC